MSFLMEEEDGCSLAAVHTVPRAEQVLRISAIVITVLIGSPAKPWRGFIFFKKREGGRGREGGGRKHADGRL